MGYNVLSYDTAIADTANQMLLLNAVRASQHYPRSFTSVGEIAAGPPLTASLASTLNFTGFTGLQTYDLNPSINASPGYTQFTLGNLNDKEYLEALRRQIPLEITNSFRADQAWPRELLDLIYIQYFRPTERIVNLADSTRKSRCSPGTPDPGGLCELLSQQIGEFTSRCNSEHFIDINVRNWEFRRDQKMYYNSAANYCHYARFRIFLEEVRLLGYALCEKPAPGCLLTHERSALDMIGYLGELIAAQNYTQEPFIPLFRYGLSVGVEFQFVDVPLFVVRRGEPLGSAAVAVYFDGMTYYIPRPEFGSRTEARSLQTLDLVLQTVRAATQSKDLPKIAPAFSLIR
jgi:hypothetical protein